MRTAFLAQLASDIVPGEDIQWMPPGKHTIRGFKGAEKKPATQTLTVDAEVAGAVKTALVAHLAAAEANRGDRPYLDFNHDDREAAAWVREIYWAGEDPKAGGIRARVEWSAPGRAAIEGRAYRRFSPNFLLDEEGRVVGAPLNMGGLVNRAAFKTIEPMWSKAPENREDETMADEVKNQLDAIATRLSALEAALKQTPVAAKDAGGGDMEARLKALETAKAAPTPMAAKEAATVLVAAAVKEGRIPAQAVEMQAKWVDLIAGSPTAAELLKALPAASALSAGTAMAAKDAGPADPTQKIAAMVQEMRAKCGLSFDQAWSQVRAAHPELFSAAAKA